MRRTLIIEDDPHIADVMEFLLREQGHGVDRVTSGTEGLRVFAKAGYDLVLLDLGLPGMDGLEVFGRIRKQRPEQPVIMVTARGEQEDRVKGLNLGVDDYVVKPFANEELVLRIRNLLRRCPAALRELTLGPVRLDPEKLEVRLDGVPVELPVHEARLLSALLERPGRVRSRERLLERMYGPHTEVSDRAVDQAVARLRKRLGGRVVIRPVYGRGYRLEAE